MTSSRPYLARAIYEWLLDNNFTPYMLVDANFPDTCVPRKHVDDGKIVLNLDPQAIAKLRMGNDAVEFDARFSGNIFHVYVPIPAVNAIYSAENGRGMVFSPDDLEEDTGGGSAVGSKKEPVKKAPPNLKIIK